MTMLKKIAKICVYALVFLLPLFFLPFGTNVLDFQKQTLLAVLTAVATLCVIGDVLANKRFSLNFNFFNLAVLVFLAASLLISLFSAYSYGSLWGLPLSVSSSFLTVLGFIFLYFLIVNLFKKEEIYTLLATIAASGLIAALFGVLQLYGHYLFPFDFSRFVSFNTVGTVNALAVFLAVILSFIIPLSFLQKGMARIFLVFCSVFMFLLLVLINFSLAWLVFAVGLAGSFVFNFINPDRNYSQNNFVVLSVIFSLLLVSLLFVGMNYFAKGIVSGIYGNLVKTPVEVGLSQKTTLNIAIETLKQSPKYLLWGSGPGTFVYDFTRFKPEAINQTEFWSTRFTSGASEMLGRAAETGLVGILFFLLLIVFATVKAVKMVNAETEEVMYPLAVFSGWIAIVAASLFYPFNMTLTMLFWVLAACIIAYDEEKIQEIELSPQSRTALAAPMVFVLLLCIQTGLLIWISKRYYAEMQYAQAMRAMQASDVDGATRNLENAVNSTGGLQDNYLRDLAQLYIFKIRQEVANAADPNESIKTVTPLLGNAVNLAKNNTDNVNGADALNWATRGYVYRQLIGLVKDADGWAVTSYNKAIDLEPSNAYFYTELAQVYLAKKDMAAAEESLNKALAMNGTYSNARYYLGLIYDANGKKEEAIKQFEIIAQYNTDNLEVRQILENLRAGRPAIAENQPSQQEVLPPVSDGTAPAIPEGAAPSGSMPASEQGTPSATPDNGGKDK